MSPPSSGMSSFDQVIGLMPIDTATPASEHRCKTPTPAQMCAPHPSGADHPEAEFVISVVDRHGLLGLGFGPLVDQRKADAQQHWAQEYTEQAECDSAAQHAEYGEQE